MKDAKFYGLCLERLRFQVGNAKKRIAVSDRICEGLLLESYNTSDPEAIIDILELYDIEDRSLSGVLEKLDDVACTVSLLLREKIGFGLTGNGDLGLYWAAAPAEEIAAQAEPREVYTAAQGRGIWFHYRRLRKITDIKTADYTSGGHDLMLDIAKEMEEILKEQG